MFQTETQIDTCCAFKFVFCGASLFVNSLTFIFILGVALLGLHGVADCLLLTALLHLLVGADLVLHGLALLVQHRLAAQVVDSVALLHQLLSADLLGDSLTLLLGHLGTDLLVHRGAGLLLDGLKTRKRLTIY